MAISSVHFEPTTSTFGDLNVRTAPPRTAILSADVTPQQRQALVHILIALGFILAFVVALSALYLGDQLLFSHSHIVTASQPAATYNGFPVDYD